MPPSPLTPTEIAANILDFGDAELMAAPNLDVHAREVRLLDANFTGIAIRAQSKIQVSEQSSLPIAIASRYDGARDWDFPLVDNCLLVATDMHSGRVQVVPGLVPPKVLASRAGGRRDQGAVARPSPEQLEGAGAQISWTEATSRMEIPWHGGHWTFGMIYFDWLSNLVAVELTGGAPAGSPARVPLTVRPLPAPEPSALPTYQRQARTPPVPPRGLAFEVTKETVGQLHRLRIDGAFTAPARAYSLVSDVALSDGGQPSPVAAIVPLTMLWVGARDLYPWRLDFAVPVYGAPVQKDQMVEGCFALDALADSAAPKPGTYACYLVLDGVIYGPKSVHVTT
jgi:hypothetical protein